jgi:GH25 family lysozyme M1 (1,4-beta-N-acetylmuramidase)
MTRGEKMNEVFGIDVSHHNGSINWEQVAHDNKKFAILKCQYEAQSHRKDEYFEANYAGAGKYGMARGVYIYIARASMADPVLDANSLLKHLAGRKLEYGIWLDLEDKTVEAKGKAYIRNLAYQYADIFKKAGYYVGIYCNRDWYVRLIHDDLKRDFDFWIARYPRNDTGVYNKTSSLKPNASIAVAWQYSSKGNVAGIMTKTDLNVDYDGVVSLIAGTPVRKTIDELAYEVIDGRWGTKQDRKQRLTLAGYDYKGVQKKVNEILANRK